MFIFERLIGVGTYSLILVLVCLFISSAKSYKTVKRVLFWYSIVLSVLAFFYIPYVTADLYRIFDFVENYVDYSFAKLIKSLSGSSTHMLSPILYWLIGKTGVPNLLPALTSMVCYSCIFYIISRTAEKNEISTKNVAIAVLFYMSLGTYIFVISGIRCMLGISLFVFCFFRESAEKKFNVFHIPLYIIAAFIHAYVAVLVAARFIVAVFDTKTDIIKKIIYIFFLVLGAFYVLRNFKGYIDHILDKAEGYIVDGGYSYFWDYLIGIITCGVIVAVLLRYKKIKSKGELKLNVLRMYSLCAFLFAVCVCFEFSIFHRTVVYVVPMACLPLLMTELQLCTNEIKALEAEGKSPKVPFTFDFVIIMVSLLLLLLSCSRGSLCSFKFLQFG